MRSKLGVGFVLTTVASSIACGPAEVDSERLVAAQATVALLSQSQQVVTPSGLHIEVIASVQPPKVGETTVQANSFWLDGDMAYIAYNNAGLPLVGAIDVVDLSVPAQPRLISQRAFATQKINAVAVSQGTLFYSGSSSELGGAVLGKIALTPDRTLGSASSPVRLSSYAGTGVAAREGALYATSGDGGGLTAFDPNLHLGTAVSVNDARDVSFSPDGKTLAVVSGQPASVRLFDREGAASASYKLGGASIAESKSTVQLGGRLILASTGDAGFSVVCAQNGVVVASQPAPAPAGDSVTGVTNAVTAGAGFVFAANGLAGVYVYQLTRGPVLEGTNCTRDSLSELGHLDLGQFSANMVYFRNDYLFVADGLGGFRILTVRNDLAATELDNDFVDPGTGLLVLSSSADQALSLSGNASLSVADGYVHVNSSAQHALSLSGNARVSANATFVTGQDSMSGNASVSGTLALGAAALADPLSWLPAPVSSSLPVAATSPLSISGNSVRALAAGVYQKGIQISANAKVTLAPGIYYLTDGGLTVSGNGVLTGDGVLIYSASQSSALNLSGNGRVQLTPMTSGTYAGITYFEERSSKAPVTLAGNGSMDIRGTLYMAGAPLTLAGNSQLPILGSLDIANTVSISGNGTVQLKQ